MGYIQIILEKLMQNLNTPDTLFVYIFFTVVEERSV